MTLAELRENLQVSVDTLRSHKVRSTLTVLGIVIGVSSVIAVAAIIDGLNRYVSSMVEDIGSRTYFVARFPAGTDPGRLPEKYRTRKYIASDSAERIRPVCTACESVTTFGTRGFIFGDTNQIQYEDNLVERVIIRGVEPDYERAIPMFAVEQGRFISEYDLDHSSSVVVLGYDIAESLFPFTDPVNKTVRLNGKIFQVIGVFGKYPGLFGGPGVDDFAIIPLSAFRKMYPESKELIIAFMVAPEYPVDAGIDQVTAVLRQVRRVPTHAESDFEIISPDFLTTLWNQLTGALVLLTGVISSVGLVVGGIGVMNIMLISVTERTKEIGVRKAIGARRSDIRVQFLMEAIMLSVTGGILGIAAGGFIAFLVRSVVPSIPATLSTFWIGTGVGISIMVGVFFGFYPANRASNLDPIACLRYE